MKKKKKRDLFAMNEQFLDSNKIIRFFLFVW